MISNNDLDKIADRITADFDIDRACDECVTQLADGSVMIDVPKLNTLSVKWFNGDEVQARVITELMIAAAMNEPHGKPN